ncbi:MAG: hypothetical protein J5I93_00690 [Pirellulaceae bacterium]|nr:hypothetical protein [Pirellulaceae bacterium]
MTMTMVMVSMGVGCGVLVSCQAADELTDTLNAWQRRRERIDAIHLLARGKGFLAANSIPTETEAGMGPSRDFHYTKEVELYFDFATGRARNDSLSGHLDGGQPLERFRSLMFDSSRLLDYRPRNRNPDLDEYQIQIFKRADARFPFFSGPGERVPWYACGYPPGTRFELKNLRPAVDAAMFRFHGFGVEDGEQVIVLRTIAESVAIESFVEIWVRPSRDYCITRVAHCHADHVSIEISVKPEQIAGEWMPGAWTFYYRDDLGQATRIESVETVSVELNPKLDHSLFTISEQPGMVVSDEANDLIYVVPEPGAPLKSRAEVMAQARQSKSGFWFAGVAVLIGIAIATFLFARTMSMPSN